MAVIRTSPLISPEIAAISRRVRRHSARVLQQLFAGRRQSHAIAQALENRHADLRFELQNLAIDRRRSDIELFGGPPDRPDAGDLVQIAQNDRMHEESGLETAMPKKHHLSRNSALPNSARRALLQ